MKGYSFRTVEGCVRFAGEVLVSRTFYTSIAIFNDRHRVILAIVRTELHAFIGRAE